MVAVADESIVPCTVKDSGSQVFCVAGSQTTGQADMLAWQY